MVCRGKLLNVRDAGVAQINGNAEINAIKQILGLQHGKVMPPQLSGKLGQARPMVFRVSMLTRGCWCDAAEL